MILWLYTLPFHSLLIFQSYLFSAFFLNNLKFKFHLNMAEYRENKSNMIISILMSIFIYYAITLSFMEGSDNNIVNCLFNMILVLAILLFIINKTKIKKEGIKLKQTYLEQYFEKK